MIPANTFTPEPVVSAFIPPNDEPFNPFAQIALGGIALNDPSQGRSIRRWLAYYDGVSIHIKPEDGPVELSLVVPNIRTLSLAFDNNISPVLTWLADDGAALYYYDTITSQFITRSFPGVTSCRVAVDDMRDFYIASSDVIFAYTLNGNLCWRQQRDRYDVERTVGATNQYLLRLGQNISHRLQFELTPQAQ